MTIAKAAPRPDPDGYYGEFGGRFVAETLVAAIEDLDRAYRHHREDKTFLTEYHENPPHLRRSSQPHLPRRATHPPLRRRPHLPKTRRPQPHRRPQNQQRRRPSPPRQTPKQNPASLPKPAPVNTASPPPPSAPRADLECVIYMGEEDIARQAPNVQRMELLGAVIRPVTSGSKTLKDALNEALRDWVTHVDTTFYVNRLRRRPPPLPHDSPRLQRHHWRRSAPSNAKRNRPPTRRHHRLRRRRLKRHGHLPPLHRRTRRRPHRRRSRAAPASPHGHHAATLSTGAPGVLHGSYSYLIQNEDGQIAATESISAGLGLPWRRPRTRPPQNHRPCRICPCRRPRKPWKPSTTSVDLKASSLPLNPPTPSPKPKSAPPKWDTTK